MILAWAGVKPFEDVSAFAEKCCRICFVCLSSRLYLQIKWGGVGAGANTHILSYGKRELRSSLELGKETANGGTSTFLSLMLCHITLNVRARGRWKLPPPISTLAWSWEGRRESLAVVCVCKASWHLGSQSMWELVRHWGYELLLPGCQEHHILGLNCPF